MTSIHPQSINRFIDPQVYEQAMHGAYRVWLVGAWRSSNTYSAASENVEKADAGRQREPETRRLERILLNESRPPCELHKIRAAANYAIFVSALDRPPARLPQPLPSVPFHFLMVYQTHSLILYGFQNFTSRIYCMYR